jgi:syntaxin-binding protein 1
MVPLLDDRAVSSTDKVRIIALYILHRDGVPDEDRRRLFQHARLSLSEQESVNNLIHLGAKVVKAPNERTSKTRIKMKPTGVEEEYELSRYRPVIRSILEDHHNNKLDQTNFPYLRDAPVEAGATRGGAPQAPTTSLRSARPTWHKAPSARLNNTEGKQRMILFVAGGITYSEMRLAYTIGRALGKEVIIGELPKGVMTVLML